MKPALRIVIIEDSPDDALLVVREVEHAGYAVQAQRVQTAEELRDALAQGTRDLVLADYSLPHFSATEGLAILKETGLDVPFIVVSGSIGEEVAVQVMKDGATDCVMKEHMSRLGPVVQRELRDAAVRRRRAEAEQALRQSEDKYRMLTESIKDVVWIVDTETLQYLYVSPSVKRLRGYTPEEIMAQPMDAALTPEGAALVRQEIQRQVEDFVSGRELPDMFYTTDMEQPCKDGSTVWTETITSYYRDDQTGHVVVRGVSRDITDRKQMEEKLRMSEFDLRQAQALAHVGSWRWDIAHDELIWSDEMYRIYGIARPAFTGSWQDVIARVVHPDDRARVEEANRAVVEDHNPQPLEYRIVRSDGSVRTVWDETGEVTLDNKGHVSSLTGVALDITQRKHAEAEKEAMQAQLLQSQKMEAIGELAGGVAHDFNNLLTAILGNIAIIRGDLPTSDPLLAYLLAAETAAHQAADLTKGLLTFSRRAMVSAVPLDMEEVVDTTLTILKQSLPATMNIIHDVEQPAWSVLADHSQIAQVILNLAVNARDAMHGKGTLTIRLRNVQVDEEYVHTHPFARTGDFVHLSVADSGPGIPPEIRSHLFEPFHTTKPTGYGTGLGLSVVYGAIKQANGWVTADSPPGAGTVFDIFLPRCLDKPSAKAVPDRITANVCSGTILVVEDEPVVCAVTQALLTRSGCAVLTAGDGASALAIVREHPGTADLVLLDMTMPGMTTQEIVLALRALTPSVPILLTSGYASSDTVKRMLEEGTVQGFLPKPYKLKELLSTINQLLERP
jgi:two-component system, cell cycle sensor histidine kinase and response regulator CckA